MIKKITLIYLIFGFFCCVTQKGYSQINFSNPNITFTQACASSGFNNFNFSFSFFPPSALQPGNQFIVELSDNTGSFASPTVVKVLTNTTSPVSSNFSLPTDAYGEGYRIRVRSTAPVKISNPSNAFAAYYAIHNQPFAINSNIGTVSICDGETYTLQVDDTGTPASPLYYPSLTYRWRKNSSIIAGATGPTLTVSEPGQYYAEVNYGSCTMNSYSNIVQVQVMSNLTPAITSQGNSTIICPSGSNTLTSSITSTSYTYQWYRDNVQIAGATGTTYNAAEEGTYYLAVANGPCVFNSNTIILEEQDFNLSINPAAATTILPGESITISAIDDANGPLYQWLRNGAPIAGATTSTYNATQPGIYKAIVTQTSPCNIIKEIEVTLISPAGYNLAIQPSTAYTECSTTSLTLNIAQFEANTSEGIVNLMANPYGYAYQWYKDDVAVTGATASALTISSAAQNGVYKLGISMPGYGEVTSNTFEINVPLAPVVISGDTILCEGSPVILTSNQSNAAYTYQWYKDAVAIAGETTSTLSATTEGQYYIVVTGGNCFVQSNTITLTEAEITISSTDPETDVIIPGETKTRTVTTNAVTPAFSWQKDGAPLSGTTATVTATQAGAYTVEVMQMTGCNATAQKTFVLEYPSSFNLNIATAPGYTSCTSATANLQLGSFMAITSEGNIDVTSMPYAYQWYKNDVAVTGATSSTLSLNSASQNGTYKLGVTIPDFGEIFSNVIIINLAIQPVTITSDTALCEGSTTMLTASINSSNYTYQWYKDSGAIAGATSSTYTANAEGDYYVQVASGACSVTSNTINLTIAGISVNSTFPATDDILPGETKVITVTTNAQVPAYSWTRDGVPVANNTATLTTTQDGVYTVTVTQTDGCPATEQRTFTLSYPSALHIAVTAGAGYTACVSTSTTVTMTGFTATTSNGIVDVTAMGYPLQWYKNDVPVPGQVSATIAISNASQNGDYKLGASVPGFGTIFSNIITISLAIETVTISNNTALCEGGTVNITSTVNNAGYTYQWFRDGIALGGASAPSFTANAEGSYYLEVTGGSCVMQSNTITLVIGGISVSSTSPGNDVILPGDTKVITVTTDAQGPAYSWTRNGVPLANTTPTLNATQNGEYIVTVTQTTGCNATAQETFILEYPTGFELTIAADAAYTPCLSTYAVLNIASFSAITSLGNIDVTSAGYAYQWNLNGTAIAGATSASLTVNNASQNGEYTLVVLIPGFEPVVSAPVNINLNMGTVDITVAGDICVENPTVDITSNVNNASYTYTWYKNGVQMTATTPGLTASETGDYYVVVNTGYCTYTSNTVAVTEAAFELTTGNITVEYVIPGETNVLSVFTDALSPQYEWYRNGVLITGQTAPSLTVTLDGEYKVVVTQTAGCTLSNELDFTVAYPTDFLIDIEAATYIPCNTTSTGLTIYDFSASTPAGPVDVPGNGYGYQWYLNDVAITGATLPQHAATQSGNYYLEVVIPEIGTIISNSISLQLGFEDDVEITADGVLCNEGGSVALSSDANNAAYVYKWFNSANEIIGTESTVTVSEPGSYYLAITYQNCIITSNILDVEVFDMNQVTIDSGPSLSLLEGTTTIVTASGAESYEWFMNGTSIATGPTLTIDGPGSYSVIATVGDCQVTKVVDVTTRENNLIAIPNVITPNNDGINDKWVLPVQYATETTEVVIYGPDGSIVFRASNYNNNWPESDFTYSLSNPVYYFTIMENNQITERGSITLIK